MKNRTTESQNRLCSFLKTLCCTAFASSIQAKLICSNKLFMEVVTDTLGFDNYSEELLMKDLKYLCNKIMIDEKIGIRVYFFDNHLIFASSKIQEKGIFQKVSEEFIKNEECFVVSNLNIYDTKYIEKRDYVVGRCLKQEKSPDNPNVVTKWSECLYTDGVVKCVKKDTNKEFVLGSKTYQKMDFEMVQVQQASFTIFQDNIGFEVWKYPEIPISLVIDNLVAAMKSYSWNNPLVMKLPNVENMTKNRQ